MKPRLSFRIITHALICVVLAGCGLWAEASPSKLPVQRLGTSDFRLSPQGGRGPTFRFSPDGKLVAGANWQEVSLWSFPYGELLHDFSGTLMTDCIGFAQDGKELLALEQRRMEIYRFDVTNGQLLAKVRLEDVVEERSATTYRLSENGRWLYMTGVSYHLVVWDTVTGKRQFRKKIGIGEGGIGGTSEVGVLTLAGQSLIERFDIHTGEMLSSKRIYREMQPLASNPQGTLLAACSAGDKAIIFWDTANDKQVGGTILLGEEDERDLSDAAISADGRRFVFWKGFDKWRWNRQVAIFEVETGKLLASFDPPGIYFLDQPEISPDGRFMFLAGSRSVFTPIDTTTGKLVRDVPDHVLGIRKLAFTPDGRTLLVGSADKRQAWNVDTGEPGTVFEKWYHTPSVAAVNNDSALISGIKDGGIRLQNIESGAVEREYEGTAGSYFSEIQLSVDRKNFVGMESLHGGHIRRWNIADGKVVRERQLPVVDFARRADTSKMILGLTLGGSRVVRLEQVEPPSRRPDGSINRGSFELVLEEWSQQIPTNRLPLPARGRFAFADNGTEFVVVVSDDVNPPHFGEQWGSTHLIVWDVATGWERLHIDRLMHNHFDAFSIVAMTRDGRLAATVSEHDRVEIWNGLNGYKLDSFESGSEVSAIAFSHDGTLLATGHTDGSVYLWSTRAAWDQTGALLSMGDTAAQRYWNELGEEGRKPAIAWQYLIRNPKGATEMLRKNLNQIASEPGLADAFENAIASLSSEGRAASDGSPPVPLMMQALHQAIEKAPSDESRAHYQQLLDAASRPLSPETRRPILAILLAEQLDTAESQELIEKFAAGAGTAYETQVAKAALARIRSNADSPETNATRE
jgi:WD40 repeat protein